MAIDRRQRGLRAEERAAAQLQNCGFVILARNFRCRTGELDIVARRESLLVIAEVRMRSNREYGGPAASITYSKQTRIRRAARYFLARRPSLASLTVRFDALLMEESDGPMEWIENAFT